MVDNAECKHARGFFVAKLMCTTWGGVKKQSRIYLLFMQLGQDLSLQLSPQTHENQSRLPEMTKIAVESPF